MEVLTTTARAICRTVNHWRRSWTMRTRVTALGLRPDAGRELRWVSGWPCSARLSHSRPRRSLIPPAPDPNRVVIFAESYTFSRAVRAGELETVGPMGTAH